MIKMIIKGRSPTMRHVSRTHRVALDWLFDRINLDPKIQIKYVYTKNQLVDTNFSKNEWNHLLCLFNIMNLSIYSCGNLKSFLCDWCHVETMTGNNLERWLTDSQYKEETSSPRSGSRVNPGNDAPGNWELGNSQSEVENSQVSRQEKVLQAAKKLVQKDQTQIKREPSRHKETCCMLTRVQNMEYTNHRYMGKIFQKSGKKLRMSAINATFSMDAYKTMVLIWRLLLASSMKAAIHLGPDLLTNSKVYKNTKFENIWSVFNITRKLIKEQSEEF